MPVQEQPRPGQPATKRGEQELQQPNIMVLSEDEEAQMAYHMSTTDETMRFYDVDELQELIYSDADCRSPA